MFFENLEISMYVIVEVYNVLSLGTFCHLGRFVRGTFCPWDVLFHGTLVRGTLCLRTFSPWIVLSRGTFCPVGHFVPWNVLSRGTFCLCTITLREAKSCRLL